MQTIAQNYPEVFQVHKTHDSARTVQLVKDLQGRRPRSRRQVVRDWTNSCTSSTWQHRWLWRIWTSLNGSDVADVTRYLVRLASLGCIFPLQTSTPNFWERRIWWKLIEDNKYMHICFMETWNKKCNVSYSTVFHPFILDSIKWLQDFFFYSDLLYDCDHSGEVIELKLPFQVLTAS